MNYSTLWLHIKKQQAIICSSSHQKFTSPNCESMPNINIITSIIIIKKNNDTIRGKIYFTFELIRVRVRL